MLSTPESQSPEDVPVPVLLNTWKHHAGALRQRIEAAAGAGPPGLDDLAGRLVVIGTELMDLYVGRMSPGGIAGCALAFLAAAGRLSLDGYRAWIQDGGGYRAITLDEDGSRWILRLGDEAERYVHLHPGRWSPQTLRVRANVLKTAVMALAHVGLHGGDPLDRDVVNLVRRQYLALAPVGKDLASDEGIGKIIDLLRAVSSCASSS